MSDRRAAAAVATLRQLGYTWEGGELWKPPIGPAPDFEMRDNDLYFRWLIDPANKVGGILCRGRRFWPSLIAAAIRAEQQGPIPVFTVRSCGLCVDTPEGKRCCGVCDHI